MRKLRTIIFVTPSLLSKHYCTKETFKHTCLFQSYPMHNRDVAKLRRERLKHNSFFVSKTKTLHLHHAFIVHLFSVPAQLRHEMAKF